MLKSVRLFGKGRAFKREFAELNLMDTFLKFIKNLNRKVETPVNVACCVLQHVVVLVICFKITSVLSLEVYG